MLGIAEILVGVAIAAIIAVLVSLLTWSNQRQIAKNEPKEEKREYKMYSRYEVSYLLYYD